MGRGGDGVRAMAWGWPRGKKVIEAWATSMSTCVATPRQSLLSGEMVQTFSSRAGFDIPFNILCPVYFLRYPNPLASHVISVDVLSREILTRPRQQAPLVSDKKQGKARALDFDTTASDSVNVLKTTRLILKKGTLPKWAPKGLIRNAESWVLEESEVELDGPAASSASQDEAEASMAKSHAEPGVRGRTMRSWTRNLDHTTVMAVTEANVFTERAGEILQGEAAQDKEMASNTALDTHFQIESGLGFSLLRNRVEKFGLNRVVTHVDTSRQGIDSTFARFVEERGLKALAGAAGLSKDVLSKPAQGAVATKRQRLAAALRPPFLDGDFVGPIARLRQRLGEVRVWWKSLARGGTGDEDRLGVRRSSGAVVDMAPQRTQDARQQDISYASRHGAKSNDDCGTVAEDARDEDTLTPMELLRKRFLYLRDGRVS